VTRIRSGSSKGVKDKRSPGQRSVDNVKQKFPEIAPKATPGDKGTRVQVPYQRVKQPGKRTARYYPDAAVPGYGPNATGGVWRSNKSGKVIGTSKSPTKRLQKPTPELANRPPVKPTPRAPRPPLNATQRASKKANPGLFPTASKKRTVR
jgi:hypothetical protein